MRHTSLRSTARVSSPFRAASTRPPRSLATVVTLVKDTSLAFSLGVLEMFTQARAIVTSQRTMAAFAVAALIYWVTCLIIEYIMRRIEKKLDYYHD